MDDWQVSIGDLLMGPDTQYNVQGLDGAFGKPQMVVGDTPRPLADGDFYGRDWLGPRTITLTVDVWDPAGDPAGCRALVDAFMAAWQLVTPDTTTVASLVAQVPGRGQVRWKGRPREVAVDDSMIGGGRATITARFFCADPLLYAYLYTVASVALPVTAGQRSYPRTYPLAFGDGAVAGGSLVATNAGNHATYPVIQFDGPCVSPAAINETTGETWRSTLTLADGDRLVVDMAARTVTLNGAQRWDMTADSSWWALRPGDNTVRFAAAASVVGPIMIVQWASAWAG